MDEIQILGAEEHNLKCVNVRIPKRCLVAFTGVSGSGKSSLIFDTLFAESYRRYSDASQVPTHLFGRQSSAPGRRPKFHAIRGLPPALGLSQRQGVAGKLSTVGTVSGVADLMRVYFAAFGQVSCRTCDIPLQAMTFREVMDAVTARFAGRKITVFAPIVEKRKGAFADEIERFRRSGFTRLRLNGGVIKIDGDQAVPINARKLNTLELVVDGFQLRQERKERAERAVAQAIEIANLVRVEAEPSVAGEPPEAEVYNLSSACPRCGESAPKLDPRHFSNTSLGQCQTCEGTGEEHEGLPGDLFPCTACGGTRLSSQMPLVRVQGRTFGHVMNMALRAILDLSQREIERCAADGSFRARAKVLDEICRLTKVQCQLGVGHLTLGRSGASLAPGDLQRLRLASLLANRLRGAVYVLDEPCQGLTRQEVTELASLLQTFVADGCSVLAVEHHPDFLKQVDHVFVMGPGAGSRGGEVTHRLKGGDYASHHDTELASIRSQTAETEDPDGAPTSKGMTIRFLPATLRGVSFPEVVLQQRAIHLLRGPSGAGKSTFLNLRLAPFLASRCEQNLDDDVLASPLWDELWSSPMGIRSDESQKKQKGRSVGASHVVVPNGFQVSGVQIVRPGSLVRSTRRTVASALDVLVPLRERFAALVSSQVLGLTVSDYSWSSKKGQCPGCAGKGYLEYEQKYAPPIEVTCPSCLGSRLTKQSLVPRLRGRNFAEVLSLSIEDAAQFFANDRQIKARLEAALEFGLGYVHLNQSMESLSGGEMQRLVLTLDLKRQRVDGYWYLLTHPGTGLHLPDIQVLGQLMKKLVRRGATFVLIENREEFAEFADVTFQF
jgi:excinuclease ABC subunit A